MEKSTLISEMQKFYFGSRVYWMDGEEGVLLRLGFDPAQRLTHIAVKQGRFFGKTVYLPVERIVSASGEGVRLDINREDQTAMNQSEPAAAFLDNKSVVQLADATARGTLLLVAVQPESKALNYIVAHHLRAGKDILLRQEYVKEIASGRITVAIPDAVLQTLPAYRSDDELQREVENILFDLTPLHVDFKGMDVRVLDGVLYLDGNISSSLRGDIVQDQVLGVEGLLETKNHLVGDDRLAGDLAVAFAHDTHTRDLPIGVYPRLGVVRLSGAVHTAQQKKAAEEIAKNFTGVRSVVNDLVIDPDADMLHVMSSAEGGETGDKIPGRYIRHTK